MNKRILGGLLCAAMLCAAPALAMPGMGEGKAPVDKFPMMDANKDGSVSKEEFKKFFPQMQDGAFAAIDKNKDGSISHEEWQGFSKSHAMGRAGHPDAQMPPANEAAPKTMPLVTPRSPVLTRFIPRMPIMATAEYRRNTATTIVSSTRNSLPRNEPFRRRCTVGRRLLSCRGAVC